MEAQRLWKEIDIEVEGRCGFQQQGIHYLCATEEKMKAHEKLLKQRNPEGTGIGQSNQLSFRSSSSALSKRHWIMCFARAIGTTVPVVAVARFVQLTRAELGVAAVTTQGDTAIVFNPCTCKK